MEKINKRQARKAFNEGKEIILVPCKVNPTNDIWGISYTTQKDNQDVKGVSFDKIVDLFEMYNCNNELGNYTAYYIK